MATQAMRQVHDAVGDDAHPDRVVEEPAAVCIASELVRLCGHVPGVHGFLPLDARG